MSSGHGIPAAEGSHGLAHDGESRRSQHLDGEGRLAGHLGAIAGNDEHLQTGWEGLGLLAKQRYATN